MSVSPDKMIEFVSKLPERHTVIVFSSAYGEYIEAKNCTVGASFEDDYYFRAHIESETEGAIEWIAYVEDIAAVKIDDYKYVVSIEDMDMTFYPYGELYA